jgi:mono/diheme cytochrome c family protein
MSRHKPAILTLNPSLDLIYTPAMRKSFLLLVVGVVFAALAIGQISEDEYKMLMQSMPANVMAIRDATDTAAAAPAANKVADSFAKVAEYWKAKNAADAVTFAESARDAAKAIADGKGDKAANLMKLQQQCAGCHMAHRGGGRGSYTFK